MYNRVLEWLTFSSLVKAHIANYTVPQYGDMPDDEVETWSPEMTIAAIQKYTRRAGSSQRGQMEEIRDMLKIAHFACLTYFKLCRKYGISIDLPMESDYIKDNPLVHGGRGDSKQSN